MLRLFGLVALAMATPAMAADNNDQAAGVITSFLPMAVLYGIASLIAILTGGIQRWVRMSLWVFGLFGGVIFIAYLEYLVQWQGPGLFFLVPVIAGIIAYRRRRKGNTQPVVSGVCTPAYDPQSVEETTLASSSGTRADKR